MNISAQTRLKKVHAVIAVGLLIMFASMQNCSNVGFSQTSDSASGTNGGLGGPGSGGGGGGGGGGNTCQNTTLQQLTTPVKILVVVDMSGSNVGDTTHPGTDPQKAMRGGSIQAFFNDFSGKQNFNWGFITFAGISANAILNIGNNLQSPAFTSSAATMQSAINYFYSTTDDGQTPYKAAITLAHTAVANDANDTAQTKYIVVFLSDGLPTDYADGATGTAQIVADVQSLIAAKPGRVSFSTVYYGPTDPVASGRLQSMATAGQGQFLDTNANPNAKDFLINNVVTVPGVTCPP